MRDGQPASSVITEYLSDYIYTYFEIDNNTSILILKFDMPSNDESSFSNLTSSLFSKFLNTTRTGSAHKQSGISVQTFLSTMLASGIYFGFQVVLFTILRDILKNVYQSKLIFQKKERCGKEIETHDGNCRGTSCTKKRSWRFQLQKFAWIRAVLETPVEKYRDRVGMDAYLFLRFLRALILLFLTLSIIHIPILIPIHYLSCLGESLNEINSNSSSRWLDRINMSNLVQRKSKKLIFHLILSIFVVVWFHFMLISELKHTYKTSKNVKKGDGDNIIFVDNLPEMLRGNKNKIVQFFNSIFPEASVEARFLPKQTKKLRTQYKELTEMELRMEKIAMQIVLEKYFSRTEKSTNQEYKGSPSFKELTCLTVNKWKFHMRTASRYFKTPIKCRRSKIFGNFYLPVIEFKSKSFIQSRYQSFDMMFKRYNKLSKEWRGECRSVGKWNNSEYFLADKNPNTQVSYDKAFVMFKSAEMAHAIGDLMLDGNIYHFNNVLIAPNLDDVIWQNIRITSPALIFSRSALANILSALITIGYIIPVAFIALISQVPYLASVVPFLAQMQTRSKVLNDVLAGIIPVVTLVFLTEFAPYIFRYFSYLRCKRTGSEIEIDTQKWFFVFLFVHVFLVVTISSGISFLVERIVNNPVSIPALLANDLPKSSNFFCSFIVIRSLAYSGGNFLQLKELFFEVFYYRLGMYCPHQRLRRLKNLPVFQWGSIYPIFSVLGSIGVIYSIISPLILPLCCIGFFLVLISFKYIFEFQLREANTSETFGKLYIQALMQLYAGVYFMEFCMIGLFALANNYTLCSCMVVTLFFTIIGHFKISQLYVSKLNNFPFSKLVKSFTDDENTEPQCKRNIDIPFADGVLEIEMHLPGDHEGIAEEEQKFIKENYGLRCNIDQFSLTKSGDTKCNYL